MVETPKNKKAQVILKRQIIVKAVVTESFKTFLNYELSETVKMNTNKINQLENQMKLFDQKDPRYTQLNNEKREAEAYIKSEADQRKFISDLELNSVYSQGPIDGMVTVSVGDNLYEKLGGVELIVKDGVVQKINANPSQFQSVVG
jgi:hypothetical protein